MDGGIVVGLILGLALGVPFGWFWNGVVRSRQAWRNAKAAQYNVWNLRKLMWKIKLRRLGMAVLIGLGAWLTFHAANAPTAPAVPSPVPSPSPIR
jgi:hypothetical protein